MVSKYCDCNFCLSLSYKKYSILKFNFTLHCIPTCMCVRAMMVECAPTEVEAVALHTMLGKLAHINSTCNGGRGSLEELEGWLLSSEMDGVFWGQTASWKCQWEEDLKAELVPMPVITEKNSDCSLD